MHLIFFLSFLFLTSTPVDEYFRQVPILRQSEQWSEVISQGQQLLRDKKISNQDRAWIHSELAKCFFYLGDYEEMLPHSITSHRLAISLNLPILKVRSCNQMSVHRRVMARRNPENEALIAEAIDWMNKALNFLPETNDSFVRAQTYFNAGALHTDFPTGDKKLAAEYLLKAFELFDKKKDLDEYHRTAIRLAKLYIHEKQNKEAEEVLLKIKDEIERDRTRVHYNHTWAMLHHARGDIKEARKLGEIAWNLAIKHDLKGDREKIEAFLEKLPPVR